jgi:hypothetical protein
LFVTAADLLDALMEVALPAALAMLVERATA